MLGICLFFCYHHRRGHRFVWNIGSGERRINKYLAMWWLVLSLQFLEIIIIMCPTGHSWMSWRALRTTGISMALMWRLASSLIHIHKALYYCSSVSYPVLDTFVNSNKTKNDMRETSTVTFYLWSTSKNYPCTPKRIWSNGTSQCDGPGHSIALKHFYVSPYHIFLWEKTLWNALKQCLGPNRLELSLERTHPQTSMQNKPLERQHVTKASLPQMHRAKEDKWRMMKKVVVLSWERIEAIAT